MTTLFVNGQFQTSAGETLPWKIDCDALTVEDWNTLAFQIAQKIPFQGVYGVPSGGVPLSTALAQYAQPNMGFPFLIVDDVLTTGASMEQAKEQFSGQYHNILGLVVFSRMAPAPRWIVPMFSMNPMFNK